MRAAVLAGLIDDYAARSPHKPALTDGGDVLTYGALRSRACALAGALLRDGVVPGARVAVMAENSLEFPVLVAAASYAGFTLVPINVRLGRGEIAAILADSGSEIGFVEGQCSCAMDETAGIRWVELGSDTYRKMLATPGFAPDLSALRSGDALLQYSTGGTTGMPKGCLLTEANFAAQTANFVEAIGLNGTDRYGLLMPFFHMAAGGMLVALLMLGATGVLLPRRDPAALMAIIERERVTRLNLPAATLRDLRDANLLRRLPDVAWLAPGNGSEQDLLRLLAERVTPNVWGWYGQTEATNITTAPRSTQEALRGFGCIGRAALTARIRVVKADGTDARPGEVGELWTAGPHVMAGYWQRPDETAAAMADGEWLRSGDLVRCDADGTLFPAPPTGRDSTT